MSLLMKLFCFQNNECEGVLKSGKHTFQMCPDGLLLQILTYYC
jgi:hypothetical protein